MPAGRADGVALALRFFDELAAGFDPVVIGIAGQGEFVPALGEEVSAETDLIVGRLDGLLRSRGRRLFGGRFFRRGGFLFLRRRRGAGFFFRLSGRRSVAVRLRFN